MTTLTELVSSRVRLRIGRFSALLSCVDRKLHSEHLVVQPRISSPQSAMKMPLLGVLGQKTVRC